MNKPNEVMERTPNAQPAEQTPEKLASAEAIVVCISVSIVEKNSTSTLERRFTGYTSTLTRT